MLPPQIEFFSRRTQGQKYHRWTISPSAPTGTTVVSRLACRFDSSRVWETGGLENAEPQLQPFDRQVCRVEPCISVMDVFVVEVGWLSRRQ